MDMQEENWASFTQTGNIDAYLQYKKAEPVSRTEKPAEDKQENK